MFSHLQSKAENPDALTPYSAARFSADARVFVYEGTGETCL